MKHLLRLTGFALCLACFPLVSLFGEEKDPKISIVLSSADGIKADLKLILELNPNLELVRELKGRPNETEQPWDVLKRYLDDVFLLGVDPTRLIRVDLANSDDGVKYRSSFPIAELSDFLENLELFGIEPKRRTRTYYELSNAYEGILRVIDDFGVIGPDREVVPARGFVPIDDDIKKYALDKNEKTLFDVVFYLLNKKGSAKDRRKEYESVKEELMAAVKQKEDETKEDFELRRAVSELQLDELARYFADPKEAVIGWSIDNEKMTGNLLINLVPDKKSMLAEAVEQLGQIPSRFEGLPIPEGKILHGSINLPLDEQQKSNLVGIMELYRESGLADVKNSDKLDDSQKEAYDEIVKILSASMIDTLKEGRFDGYFLAAPSANGKFTLQGGLAFKNAKSVSRAIELVKKGRPDREVKLNIETHAGVTIHSFTASADMKAAYMDMFGGDTLYFGVGEHEFWYAIGANGIEAIKTAVTKANDTKIEKPSMEFVSLFLKLGPWVEWRGRYITLEDPGAEEKVVVKETTTDEEEDNKPKVSQDELRAIAISSFKSGNDILTFSLKRDGDNVTGGGQLDTGLLRFAGHLLAKFTVTLADPGTELKNKEAAAAK
ncbi:MAG: hypothetical protein P8M30_07400 [Planctomycetaceae bacterium]|nr:hypothetical protein [Planctomycetaceae bacterium]